MRELKPIDGRKSFYGKASIYERDGKLYLRSYTTTVAYIDKEGKLHRLWEGWSVTTARHLVSFVGHALSKKTWLSLPVEEI